MGHSCRVDKHIQTFPGWFYEVMTRLWKVLNLSYKNVEVKTYQIFCLQNNFSHFSLVKNLTFSL